MEEKIYNLLVEVNSNVIDLKKEVIELKERVTKLEERVGKLEERVGSLEEKVERLEERVGKLEEKVEKLEEKVGCLEDDGISLKEELRKISKSLAVIEVEHGNKLDILIDITKLHQEKFIAIEERIKSCENEIENNSNKIYYLNSKVQAF